MHPDTHAVHASRLPGTQELLASDTTSICDLLDATWVSLARLGIEESSIGGNISDTPPLLAHLTSDPRLVMLSFKLINTKESLMALARLALASTGIDSVSSAEQLSRRRCMCLRIK